MMTHLILATRAKSPASGGRTPGTRRSGGYPRAGGAGQGQSPTNPTLSLRRIRSPQAQNGGKEKK
jgi:hypothetical protein